MLKQSRLGVRLAVLGGLLAAWPLLAEDATVTVLDQGEQVAPVTFECRSGHKRALHLISLANGSVRYGFRYAGCVDPSHGEERPCAEGNFGMPDPTPANWYWGGFLSVMINGKDALAHRQIEMRPYESGGRGGFQALFAHPDAEVGLRLVLPADANHVQMLVTWRPKPGVTLKSVTVKLTCYPSFFTAARHRQGDRHVRTPRVDKKEGEPLQIVPDQDNWLCYYDTVFDPAKGEGDGPCAALVAPEGLKGGRIDIGGYAVVSSFHFDPAAGQGRLAVYDFTGSPNAKALDYFAAHGAADVARLRETDFRPQSIARFDPAAFKAETEQLLAQAGDDAATYRPQAVDLMARAATLKAKAAGGDWRAEADLGMLLAGSTDLIWKLKMMAALNAP